MAPRSLQLRTRSSIGHYRPSNLDPYVQDYPTARLNDLPAPPPAGPFPYGPSDARPTGPFPYGPSDARPTGPFPYGPSDYQPPYSPGGGEVAPPAYEPGGGEMPSPLPPSRPSDLGKTLAGAVRKPGGGGRSAAQTGQQQQAPQPLTTNSLFGTVQLNPNQRNAPIYTALNVGSLFGGGGQPATTTAASTAAAAPAARGQGRLGAPNSDYWTVDADGNPIAAYPGDQMSQAPWDVGPLQKGNVFKSSGGPRR